MRPIRIILAIIIGFWGGMFLVEGLWAVWHDGWSFGGGLYGKELLWVGETLVARANGNAVITGTIAIVIAWIIDPKSR